MNPRRALSLTEVVLASFLLLAVLLAVSQLMVSSARASRASEASARATMFAEAVLAEIRRWAETPANFRSNWSPYDGAVLTDPDFPGLQARVAVEEGGRRLYSPCSGLESLNPADPVTLDRSVVAVRVQVDWDPLNPAHRVRLVTLLDEPDRSPVSIRVTRSGPGDPIPQEGEITLTAELIDAAGNPVPDATFDWSVLPVTGNGRFVSSTTPRSGVSGIYKHNYIPPLGPPRYVPGSLNLQVRALYRGRPVEQSVPVVLQ
ncbi:MAG: hypothetical protein AB1758_29235 [Candidatus Eremiobacterota bacterium]